MSELSRKVFLAEVAAVKEHLDEQEQQATARAEAVLAPLAAKARALREQRDAEHRAAVLREAADIAEGLRQFERCTGPRRSAQISENVGILRVADELRRVADEAQAEPERSTP